MPTVRTPFLTYQQLDLTIQFNFPVIGVMFQAEQQHLRMCIVAVGKIIIMAQPMEVRLALVMMIALEAHLVLFIFKCFLALTYLQIIDVIDALVLQLPQILPLRQDVGMKLLTLMKAVTSETVV